MIPPHEVGAEHLDIAAFDVELAVDHAKFKDLYEVEVLEEAN